MADQEKDIHLLKRTRISVFVDEALPDILVVTYELGVKIFKGVLLDSTKKNAPCGVSNLNPALSTPSKPDDDTLYSVNQRFAYTNPIDEKKKNVHISTKYKNNKMTVRLRPRQVLCSKCKGICNENSENVTRKRKATETIQSPPIKRSADAPITRSVNTILNKKKLEVRVKRTLLPKPAKELPKALSGNVNKINIDNNKKQPPTMTNSCDSSIKSSTDITHSHEHSDTDAPDPKLKRKKQTDEETCDEDANKNNSAQSNMEQPLSSTCSNTRTIKICYGPQGEGTVLKIPAQLENLSAEDGLEENINVDDKDKDNKAARKAMKKARKEAKRKTILSGSSPGHTSPRYSVGGSSPRYTVGSASPRHGLGNNSPRYVAMSTQLETNSPKKRKHKMKHKKKHKEDKDRKHGKDGEIVEEGVKEPITQKLSINLKRLSMSYTNPQSAAEKTEDSSSDECSEQAPEFPPSSPQMLLHVNSTTLSTIICADGSCVTKGDIIWGKMHGFPWWPGKVLTINNFDPSGPRAHISWYGSVGTSLLKCDQLSPYLDNFKTRFNKKRKGAYKEAIRQASMEAQAQAEQKLAESVVSSPTRSIIPVVVQPALASPREINVIS